MKKPLLTEVSSPIQADRGYRQPNTQSEYLEDIGQELIIKPAAMDLEISSCERQIEDEL